MADDLIQQKKTQRNLIFILGSVLVVTIFVIYQGFFKADGGAIQEGQVFIQKPEIKINFDILDSSIFEDFQLFPEIEPFTEATTTEGTISIGRDNPFLPY